MDTQLDMIDERLALVAKLKTHCWGKPNLTTFRLKFTVADDITPSLRVTSSTTAVPASVSNFRKSRDGRPIV
jgi:hypothetical protein